MSNLDPPAALLKDCGVSSSNTNGNASTTPVSLLVESLVQQLCTLLEQDSTRSKQLYDSVCEKLEQMQLIDGTWNMGEFDVMRTQYQNALYQLVHVAKGPDMILSPDAENQGFIWPLPQPVTMEWSRYHKDFEELSFIAGGGFGKVYRARNKLDGIVYAVKKVIIKANSIDKVMSHLSEVKTLASLHHVNIVPYKTAWLEPLMNTSRDTPLNLSVDEDNGGEEEDDDEEDESSLRSTSVLIKSLKRSRRMSKTTRTVTTNREEMSDSIVFQNTRGSVQEGEEVWTRSYSSIMSTEEVQENCHDTQDVEDLSIDIESRAVCPYEVDRMARRPSRRLSDGNKQLIEMKPHLKLEWAVLYIQMAECQLTLRSWLDERNRSENFEEFYANFISTGLQRNRSMGSLAGDIEVAKPVEAPEKNPCHQTVVSDIFLQLINGLNYIHARDIIHHDIKPSNIFISIDHDSNILVQLGDFGLACPLQKAHRRAMVGTPQYAAPEQLKGKCDKKSDIYSLGVILLELLVCFTTDMERTKTVNDAKRNIFPETVPVPFRGLIHRLLSSNLNHRPHSFELPEIFSRICRTQDSTLEEMQRKLSTQDEQIAQLKALVENNQQETEKNKDLQLEVKSRDQELSEKNKEIQELRRRLAALETQDQRSKKQIQAKHHETRRLKKKLQKSESSS